MDTLVRVLSSVKGRNGQTTIEIAAYVSCTNYLVPKGVVVLKGLKFNTLREMQHTITNVTYQLFQMMPVFCLAHVGDYVVWLRGERDEFTGSCRQL